MRSPERWLPTLTIVVASVGLSAGDAALQSVDARQERLKAAVARVYDTSVLHRIDIVIAPEDARTILNRTSERAITTASCSTSTTRTSTHTRKTAG